MSGLLWIHATAKYCFPPSRNWENPQVPRHFSCQSYAGGVYRLVQEDKHSKGTCYYWRGVYHNSKTVAKHFKCKKNYTCIYYYNLKTYAFTLSVIYVHVQAIIAWGRRATSWHRFPVLKASCACNIDLFYFPTQYLIIKKSKRY